MMPAFHESWSRRPSDAGQLRRSADRSPAVSAGQRQQPRPYDGHQQRHRSGQNGKAFGIPTILTTINAKRGGEIFNQVQAVFPDQKPIDRTFINSWEDRRVVEAVKNTGRKKLVIAALWSEMCLAQPAIHAMGDGYDVYAVTDASGGVSPEAHDMAIRRVVAAGAQPITWLAMAGELQRDWARTERLGEVAQILFDHAGASGTVLAWELANEAQRAA